MFGCEKPVFIGLLLIGVISIAGPVVLLVLLLSPILKDYPKPPICSIEKFYIPALDKSLSGNETAATVNTTISFDIKLKGQDANVTYDALNISLYYIQKGNISRHLQVPIGHVSIPGFHQQSTEEVHRFETVQTFGVPWKEARSEVANGSNRSMFTVDLASIVMLKKSYIDPEYGIRTTVTRPKLNLGVNVSVNDQGTKTVPGSLRLTSASSTISPCSICVLVLSILCFI
ncbi:protein NDR1-like [Papaver somniferum]|uniref:protein NDR1-like n=1 Tax=Papaver somniferum TaxID=3469 RepID=UPI000E6FDEFE|nr:protein NDR1-like [Papaver somniferum]